MKMRNRGFTLIGLVAILIVMSVVASVAMDIELRNSRYKDLERTAGIVIDVAQAYDLYFTTNCGTSFTPPAVATLGVDVNGIVNAVNITTGVFTNSVGQKFLVVSATYLRNSDAVISADLLGAGAKIQADKKTVSYFFLPSLSANSQARQNWFGGVNCF